MDSTELAAYIGPATLAYRVLGPTADLLGDELRAWTERRLRNLGNIFSTLEHKYGSGGIEGLDEGAISPRVLRGILDEGSYIEDEVGTEYYGGVLAGSRTVDGRNDSAVALIEVMNTLSSPQLRAHFLIYAAAQQNLACSERFDPLAPYEAPDGGWRRIAVPRSAFEAAIAASDVAPSEDSISSVMRGLRRTELIHAVGGWLTAEPADPRQPSSMPSGPAPRSSARFPISVSSYSARPTASRRFATSIAPQLIFVRGSGLGCQ